MTPFSAIAVSAMTGALLAALAVYALLHRRLRLAFEALRELGIAKERLETERRRLTEELKLSARTDHLTGLLNRRAFVEAALHEIANATRYRRAFALVMFDVDDVRRVNERFGHDAGDAVIAAVARAAESAFRAGDLVCRYGGEEFAVFTPECAIDDVRLLTERMRRAIESLDVHVADGVTVRLTATFGAAAVDAGAPAELDTVMHVADAALARAKAEGRNRVVVDAIDAGSAASWTAASG